MEEYSYSLTALPKELLAGILCSVFSGSLWFVCHAWTDIISANVMEARSNPLWVAKIQADLLPHLLPAACFRHFTVLQKIRLQSFIRRKGGILRDDHIVLWGDVMDYCRTSKSVNWLFNIDEVYQEKNTIYSICCILFDRHESYHRYIRRHYPALIRQSIAGESMTDTMVLELDMHPKRYLNLIEDLEFIRLNNKILGDSLSSQTVLYVSEGGAISFDPGDISPRALGSLMGQLNI